MSGLISTHRADSLIEVESDNTILSIRKGEKFKLREYLGSYSIIDSDNDSLDIEQEDFDALIANNVELVVIDAPGIHKFLSEQTGKSIKPKLLAKIAMGDTNDIKTRKATHVILEFLGGDLYDAACDSGILIVLLSYLAGGYCGRTDAPICANLIETYGNPTVVNEKPSTKRKKVVDSEFTKVDGYMRLKDGTEIELNAVDIQKFYDAYDPNNPVDTLKDVGIRAEDAVITLIGKKSNKELTTPLQVNKYLKKMCG